MTSGNPLALDKEGLSEKILLSFIETKTFNEGKTRIEYLPRKSLSDIAKSFDTLTPESFTKTIEYLEAKQWLIRYPHPDKDGYKYVVTKSGEDRIKEIKRQSDQRRC